MSDLADKAVVYLLRRIENTPELAYHFGFTQSLELLTTAYATSQGLDPAAYNKQFNVSLRTEPPRCRSGKCFQQSRSGE